jgi:hypothetical protein
MSEFLLATKWRSRIRVFVLAADGYVDAGCEIGDGHLTSASNKLTTFLSDPISMSSGTWRPPVK